MPAVLLTYYCVFILVASVLGGMLPTWFKLTHRWMECAVSLVAGVMLGVALLHFLPHALAESSELAANDPNRYVAPLLWLLVGFLAMFFVERFFCFHHHDVPEQAGHDHENEDHAEEFECHQHDHAHSDHTHDVTWSGAALGLTLHSVLAGIALAASTYHSTTGEPLAGLGAFLAILLHKPFDSMTIAMLMAKNGWSATARCVVNALFSLTIPLGALLFYLGVATDQGATGAAPALAFSAGVFLCISMSDLLPELQFHHHDRGKLSAALLLGLVLAYAACRLEYHVHAPPETPATDEAISTDAVLIGD